MGERTTTLLERFRWRHTGMVSLRPVWRCELSGQVAAENWPEESDLAMGEQQMYGDLFSLADGSSEAVYAFHVLEEDDNDR